MATATEQARTLISRAVIWTGLALGTCLAVLAITDGVRLRIGGMPSVLGAVLGAAVVWALIVLAAVALAELVRRHHRTVGHYALRQAKRGAVSTARHGMTVHRWLVSKTASRWENREHRPLMFRRLRAAQQPEPAEGTEGGQGSDEAEGRTYSWGPADSPSGWPADDAETAHHWAQHMSTGGGKPQVVTEYPPGGGPGRTIATYVNGKPSTEGASSMPASPSRIKTQHRAQRVAARSGGSIPSEWGPVIAQTADFEPEDDGELLEWMSRQVTGLSAWAEALVDFYDHATNTIGIDPKASAMLHDVADAAAQAAETMSAAKARFTEHYELPREFAGNGGLMTHDGRWITGEGA
jgi:hypothetical protein